MRTGALISLLTLAMFFIAGPRVATAGILSAAKQGDLNAVKQAIANGEDINSKSGSPSFSFGSHGFDKDGGISYSEGDNWTSLIYASVNGNESIVRYLLDSGADPNIVDDSGLTAFMYAIFRGKTNIVSDFAANRKALDFKEPKFGITPLMWACLRRDDDIISAILTNKPDLTACDNDGWTTLHYAVKRGSTNIVMKLIEAGARTDVVDSFGKTCLMVAAESGNANNVELLIKQGVSKSVKSKEGKSALDYANAKLSRNNLKIVKLEGDSVMITNGFDYQRGTELGSPNVIRVTGIIGGIMQTEGTVPMGYESAVGNTWVFSKPGIAMWNGDYVYTSLTNDASIHFTKEGVILKSFKIENPREDRIMKVVAILSDPPVNRQPAPANKEPTHFLVWGISFIAVLVLGIRLVSSSFLKPKN
jgi:hypothetical protein